MGKNDEGRRLDRIVRKLAPTIPVSRIHRALRSREIRLNGRRARADSRLREGDLLEIAAHLGEAQSRSDLANARYAGSVPELPSDRILLETDDLIAVNKERGELTHGPGSLEEAVRVRLARRRSIDGVSFRPGPIHRLDRNTSGVIVYAASLRGAQVGTTAIQEGLVSKHYLGVVHGAHPSHSSRPLEWNAPLERDHELNRTKVTTDGRPARTLVTQLVVARDRSCTLVRFELITGRTHQIRAHAADAGHPLAGDHKYGAKGPGPYLLHAWTLSTNAGLGFDRLVAPPPEEFIRLASRMIGQEISDALSHPPDGTTE